MEQRIAELEKKLEQLTIVAQGLAKMLDDLKEILEQHNENFKHITDWKLRKFGNE